MKYPETIDYIDVEEQYFSLIAPYRSDIITMKAREKLGISMHQWLEGLIKKEAEEILK